MGFEIATRSGTKALIGLYGGSGSGKTLSALYMARGLVGAGGKVFLIDTESGRGSIYSDDPKIGGYLVDELAEPFSSARYADKLQEAISAAAGAEACVIIDSFSHEWEGIGGVCNAAETIAEDRARKKGFQWNGAVQFGDWKGPKQDHKRMMLKMIGAPVHLICCLRAQFQAHQIEKKDYAKHGINSNANTTVIRDEFQTPIQDKNFIYEMTVHAELRANTPTEQNRAGVPILTKCPETLRHAFPEGQRVSVDTGAAIAAWCRGGAVETAQTASLIDRATAAANNGTPAYQAFWEGATSTEKGELTGTLVPHPSGSGDVIAHELCKEIAVAHD